ncbi:MAG TPA: hypothetical protein DEA58_07745 [Pseudothermotoga sp.]|nr:hypothetical protein [Pseudothermotoga sp.]
MMKVLHITNTYNNEILKDNPVIRKIISELSMYGIEQTVIIPVKRLFSGKGEYIFKRNHIQEHVVPVWGLPYGLLIDLKLCLSAKKIFKYAPPDCDLIHAHSFISDGYIAYRLSKSLGKPLIVSITATDVCEQLLFYPHLRILARKIYDQASSVISMSEALRSRFLKLLRIKDDAKTRVIPSGIEKERFENSSFKKPDARKFQLIFVGRLVKLKNLKRTIIAVKELICEGNELEFKIIGDGPMEKQLIDIVYDLGLQNHVKFLGKLDNDQVYQKIKESHSLIMCSVRETFGLVYIEALSQYRPVIYSKGVGVDGLFEKEVGIGCDPKSIESIKMAIKEIMDHYEYYLEQVISFNQEDYVNFTLENTARLYYKLYLETIGQTANNIRKELKKGFSM